MVSKSSWNLDSYSMLHSVVERHFDRGVFQTPRCVLPKAVPSEVRCSEGCVCDNHVPMIAGAAVGVQLMSRISRRRCTTGDSVCFVA